MRLPLYLRRIILILILDNGYKRYFFKKHFRRQVVDLIRKMCTDSDHKSITDQSADLEICQQRQSHRMLDKTDLKDR
jgi:hypothetical protein